LVKKYIPKGERKKMKDEKNGVPKKTTENSSNVEPETDLEETTQPWNGEAIPEVIDSVIDFGHLRS
jgi:hypothetical protein